jgi:class 3 adenylate cyclase/pimeloyl-ACP methyl ester carboxylesterase
MGLAGISRLVVYDGRGFGLSDRDEPEFAIETQIRDLEAVLAHLGAERCDILGHFDSTPAAVTFAARHPERVLHLILWSGYANGAEQAGGAEFEAMIALADKDFQIFTQLLSSLAMGSAPPEEIAAFADFARASAEPAAYQRAWQAAATFDVRDLLPQLTVPTLVMDRQGSRSLELSRKLAASIPAAELCILESGGMVEWAGQIPAVIEAIGQFIGPASLSASKDARGTVRTVLFTDLVGHSAMMARLGDARGRELLREHERITREVLKAHGGAEVKTMGDGFMASFGGVARAVECAIELQRAFNERNEAAAETLQIRVGLNAGEPIEEEDSDGRVDLFGASVILASRIAARADGAEILVANAVRELCAGKGFLFADRGDFVAKGFEEPVRLYEVSWR